MLNIFAISILFVIFWGLNFYLTPFYFQVEITIPVLIFFAKELKFLKFIIIVLFVILMNVLLEKFALFMSVYVFIFSLLIYLSKRNFNIISFKYIFLSTLVFMTVKFLIIYSIFYRNLLFNGMLFLDVIFDILINSISSNFVFYVFEKLTYKLRYTSEKVLCSS